MTSHLRQIRQRSAKLAQANEALGVEIRERRRIDRARQALSRCNHVLIRAGDEPHDPDFAPWRAEALRRGYASVIGIPLMSGAEVLGALAIYAADPDAFDENEVQLLRELADDLSYGIDALRTRAACQRAEESL